MVWGWVVVGRVSFLSSQSQWFTWCLTAFFTMLVGLAMAGTSPLRVHKALRFVTNSPRDMQRTSNKWGSIFLGGHDRQASRRSLRVLGYWLVQPPRASCGDDGNQVGYRVTRRMYPLIIASSFACATFISTAATIGTNYKPNSHKTIGIYAAVLFAQGTAQTSYIYLGTPRLNQMQVQSTPLACASSST
jgi:hypothetical protein